MWIQVHVLDARGDVTAQIPVVFIYLLRSIGIDIENSRGERVMLGINQLAQLYAMTDKIPDPSDDFITLLSIAARDHLLRFFVLRLLREIAQKHPDLASRLDGELKVMFEDRSLPASASLSRLFEIWRASAILPHPIWDQDTWKMASSEIMTAGHLRGTIMTHLRNISTANDRFLWYKDLIFIHDSITARLCRGDYFLTMISERANVNDPIKRTTFVRWRKGENPFVAGAELFAFIEQYHPTWPSRAMSERRIRLRGY